MKKNLIMASSVVVLIVLGTLTISGLAIKSNNIKNGNYVEVWGYDDQVSSTALKINKYMGVDFTEEQSVWGAGTAWTAEKTLLKNSHYHSVDDDIQILDGVNGTEKGLGYLSSTWVSGYVDEDNNGDQFTMLKLYDNGVVDGVAPQKFPDRTDPENYLDPTDDNDKLKYSQVNSVAMSDDIYSEQMNATLNVSMKVTPEIANWLRPTIGTNNPLTIDDQTSPEVITFVNWLNDEGYTDDFVVSYGLFNYMAYDISNINIINQASLAGSNDSGIWEFEDGGYDVLNQSYINLTQDDSQSLLDVMLEQQKNESGSYSILVDGTGTNSGIMLMEIDNYENDFNLSTNSDEQITFRYDLNNGGSSEAWAKPNKYNGMMDGDPINTGRNSAFIGTSSRASKVEEIANFGYDADESSLALEEAGSDIYLSPEQSNENQILSYTMGVDLPVFFINKGMTFEHTVTETSINCIENATVNGGEEDINVGDKIEVTPVGISDLAAKEIYEYGATWDDVLNNGLLIVDAV